METFEEDEIPEEFDNLESFCPTTIEDKIFGRFIIGEKAGSLTFGKVLS
jgi:hypothetical protein